MLAHAIEETISPRSTPPTFPRSGNGTASASRRWRASTKTASCVARLYSRTGEDISKSFPDLVDALRLPGAIDGELLIMREAACRPSTCCNSGSTAKPSLRSCWREFPAHLRAYDLLVDGDEDLRALPFAERRHGWKNSSTRLNDPRIDISPLVPFKTWDELTAARADPASAGRRRCRRGRRRHAQAARRAYVPGRPKGLWWKWKRDPMTIDAVLMYAQRGHGKRSSYLFRLHVRRLDQGRKRRRAGAGRQGLFRLHRRGVASRSIASFAATPSTVSARCAKSTHEPDNGLVLEVAFEGLQRSTRHKSGLAMRFPRISRLRWDKPPREADRLETLENMLQGIERGRRRTIAHCGDGLDRHLC